jgi:hypothetical protein
MDWGVEGMKREAGSFGAGEEERGFWRAENEERRREPKMGMELRLNIVG